MRPAWGPAFQVDLSLSEKSGYKPVSCHLSYLMQRLAEKPTQCLLLVSLSVDKNMGTVLGWSSPCSEHGFPSAWKLFQSHIMRNNVSVNLAASSVLMVLQRRMVGHLVHVIISSQWLSMTLTLRTAMSWRLSTELSSLLHQKVCCL